MEVSEEENEEGKKKLPQLISTTWKKNIFKFELLGNNNVKVKLFIWMLRE